MPCPHCGSVNPLCHASRSCALVAVAVIAWIRSGKLHSIVIFCCNWVIMVKQLSNSPKVAQPSNNVTCPVLSHSCSSNIGICQKLHWVNENMTYCVRQYGTAHQLSDAIWQKALRGLHFNLLATHKSLAPKLWNSVIWRTDCSSLNDNFCYILSSTQSQCFSTGQNPTKIPILRGIEALI